MGYGNLIGHEKHDVDAQTAAELVALESEHFDLTSRLVQLEHLLADPSRKKKQHDDYRRQYDEISAKRAKVDEKHDRLAKSATGSSAE